LNIIFNIKGKILKSEFIKNIFVLITGTSIAQVISILISPILSRLYTPEDFGVLALFMSIVSAIAVIASVRYEISIVLPKKDSDAINLLALSFFFILIISFLSLLGVLIFNFFLFDTLNINNRLKNWLYFLPLMVLLLGIYQSLSNWANRKKKYKSIVFYRVSNSATVSSINLILGIFKFGAIGLLIGTVFGHLTAITIFFKKIFNSINSHKKEINKSKMIEMAKVYKEFPLVNSFQAISDMFQINGIIYFISYFFCSVVVGTYFYAMKILQVPMNLIGAAISQVFYQRSSEIYNDNKSMKNIVKSTIIKSALIGLPILLIFLFTGPQLFAFVFGNEWREAGVYASILSPWIFFDFIRAPISQIPLIINKQKKLFILSLIGNAILIISMIYGGLITEDVIKGFYMLSSLESLFIITIIIWIYKISDCKKQ